MTEQACCERAKVHDSPMVGVVESNRMSQRSPILFVVRSRNIELMFTPKSRGYTVIPPHTFFICSIHSYRPLLVCLAQGGGFLFDKPNI